MTKSSTVKQPFCGLPVAADVADLFGTASMNLHRLVERLVV
jgi:hypothetical protein